MKSRAVRGVAAAAVLAVAAGCKDILAVQNPQAFTNEAANSTVLLPAVAAGAEGDFQISLSNISIFNGMLSDEFWHTGTWSDWLDVSKGLVRANWPINNSNSFMSAQNQLLRARGTAANASARFEKVMGDSAHTSPLFVTSQMARAWSDLYIALSICQAPSAPGAALVSDTALFKQAADSFAALIPIIQNAHYTKASDRQDRLNQAYAALARSNLMLGNYDKALQYAQLVPPTFQYNAIFSSNSGFQNNTMAGQGNANYNRSFSIRGMWFSQIDTVNGFLRDPSSGKDDPRVPLGHDNNNVKGYDRGSDGVTKFFSNNKYPLNSAPIAISKAAEMNLIIAEVQWHNGDNASAINTMNINRTAVSLPPLVLPATGDVSTQVRDLILQERFAVLFGEGQRTQDLYRFHLVTSRLGAGRATKLPLTRTEQLANPNIGEGKETCPAIS